jgi:hypothetical protein
MAQALGLRGIVAVAATLAVAVLILGGSLVHNSRPAMAGQSTTVDVRQDPSAASLFLGGGELVIAERVEGVPGPYGLGSFDVRVNYAEATVDVSFQKGPFLASTGRTPFCQNSSGNGQAVLSCFTTGEQAGPTGDGIIGGLIVEPEDGLSIRPAAGNGIEVILDNHAPSLSMRDINDIALATGLVGDTRLLVRALEGDVNVDCSVDVVDGQLMAIHLGTTKGEPMYSEQYDLEPAAAPDGDVDTNDMQVVWGRTGSSCAAPNPPQPPPDKSTPTPTRTPTPSVTPTDTVTPTITPTPACTDFDGDTLCDHVDPDDDSDLCSDVRELSTAPEQGGMRNPQHFWDFYDPGRDAAISGPDFFMVLARFGGTGNPAIDPLSPPAPPPAYHTRFDRGPLVGPDQWDLGPADGAISGPDFFALLAQFGHSCQ